MEKQKQPGAEPEKKKTTQAHMGQAPASKPGRRERLALSKAAPLKKNQNQRKTGKKPLPAQPEPMLPFHELVVDEGVGDAMLSRFIEWAQVAHLSWNSVLPLRQNHQGISDQLIVYQILGPQKLLLTTDRALHNTVLIHKLRSYYIHGNGITAKPLPGIIPKNFSGSSKPVELRADYTVPPLPIRPTILPQQPTALKKLRTKRRRIRNHFEGLENMESVALTLSACAFQQGCLIGLRVQVNSRSGKAPLMATENYYSEPMLPAACPMTALTHALILIIRLQLHLVPTILYFDADVLKLPPSEPVPGALQQLHETLLAFPQIQLSPVLKGWHLETLRNKLESLRRGVAANEVVVGDMQGQLRRFEHYDPNAEPYQPDDQDANDFKVYEDFDDSDIPL